jgi:uncharacterized membrane protein YphA (DoxX/SURF4 family)
MVHSSSDAAVLVARVLLAYVYLYAAYLNAKPENRDWLLTHTALLFPSGTSPLLIKLSAFIGVAMMFVGGFSVLVGLATWLGCVVLIAFTILGYLQHRKEVEFATKTADALAAEVEPLAAASNNATLIRQHLMDQRVSAYSG